jgi:hypothetical protein
MTPTFITTLVAAILAAVFEWAPILHEKYNKLSDTAQRLIMLGLLVLVVGGAFGLSCAGWLHAWPCTQAGAKEAVYALILAIAANQGTFQILPKGKP